MTGAGFGGALISGVHEGSSVRFDVPEGWGQGRATFGGLAAALALRSMTTVAPSQRRLRSLLVSFVGPLAPGSVEAKTDVLRSGRSVTQIEAKLVQEGAVKCAVQAAFGDGRPSEFALPSLIAPEIEGPDGWTEMPFFPGVMPDFLQHFDLRWAIGGVPYSGSTSREMGGWVKMRDSAGATPEEIVLGVVDAWPVPVLPMFKTPAPASSVTWAVEMVADPAQFDDPWWLYRAEVEAASEGYANATACLWSRSGELVAIGRQSVAYFL